MMEHKLNDHEKRICNVETVVKTHGKKINQMEKRDIYLSSRMKELCDRLDSLIALLKKVAFGFVSTFIMLLIGALAFLIKFTLFK